MGSDPIALPALDFLRAQVDRVVIAGVYTQPDRPHGRGKKLSPNAIKEWAISHGIPVRQPEALDSSELEALRAIGCDFALLMAYGHILRKSLLETPPLGTWNLHASLLPRYRGASPIPAAIASGEHTTGITLMRMVRKLDAGPVLDCERAPIDRLETGETLARKLGAACVPLLDRNLPLLLNGNAEPRPQLDDDASYCRKLEKSDGALDFSAQAETLARRINALYSWPSCFIDVDKQRIRLGLADWIDSDTAAPPAGMVVEAGERLLVAAGRGLLNILHLQRPGGRMLTAPEFLRGFRIQRGTMLSGGPMMPLAGPEPLWSMKK